MMTEMLLNNVLSWAAQAFVIVSLGALLPLIFRIRHPRSQLAYCHLLLAACVLLPFVQPWQHPVSTVGGSGTGKGGLTPLVAGYQFETMTPVSRQGSVPLSPSPIPNLILAA